MMKTETRIVTKSLKNKLYLIRRIEDFLYSVAIGQTIETMDGTTGENLTCIVTGISDSIHEDIIYRYVEVVINKVII